MKTRCPLCGKEELQKKTGTFHFDIPDDGTNPDAREFEVDIPNAEWDECGSCGEIILSHDLQKRIQRWQYTRQGMLTPEELKAIRERFGLSQVEMGRRLGVGDKSYSRWENSLSMQTKAIDNLVRMFAKNPELFYELENERSSSGSEEIRSYLQTLGTISGKQEMALVAQGGIREEKSKETIVDYIKKQIAKKS